MDTGAAMTTTDRAAARLLALDMETVAHRLRSGQVPGWCVASVAPSWHMIRHVLMGVNPPHNCLDKPCVAPEPEHAPE